jgi:hypothetical protein
MRFLIVALAASPLSADQNRLSAKRDYIIP